MKILVTGGAGFIGSEFCSLLNERNIDFKVVDKLTYASDELRLNAVKGRAKFIKKDINDLTLKDVSDCTTIVNFAAESHVDNSIKNGKPFVDTNITGTYHLLELAKKIPNFSKFVQISTDEVYGDLEDIGLTEVRENSPLVGSSYYSASKASADLLVMAAGRTFKLPFLITRTCNNFGSHQHKEKFIPSLLNSIRNETTFKIYGDGSNIREWIDVRQNVEILLQLVIEQRGIFNIGSGIRVTNNYIADYLLSVSKSKVKKEYVEDRKGHDRRYGLNCDKLKSFIGYKLPKFRHINDFLYESIKTL